jgi:hypothetical protein
MGANVRDTMTKGLVACAVVAWAVAAYFAVRGPRATPPAPASAEPPPGTAEAPPPPTATATAEPPPVDVSACVAALFPGGTFAKQKPDFAFVCEEADPLRGGTLVRSQLIRAGGDSSSTEATREWVGTGWYMIAAWTLLRARCCAAPPKPRFGFEVVCPVADELAALEAALRKKDDAGVAKALEAYTKQMRCISKFGQAENFGMVGPPGADIAAFEKMLGRAP